MILVDSQQPMVKGDRFEMFAYDWYYTVNPWMATFSHPTRTSEKRVQCEVLRVFVRSPHELRYICTSLDDPNRTEFVLGQFLEAPYKVSVSHPSLEVSALIITEAAARIGVRSISPEMPMLYTKADAEKLAAAIEALPVKESNNSWGKNYVVPDKERMEDETTETTQ